MVSRLSSAPVHPRASGEHWQFRVSWPCSPGSSPRERGTLGHYTAERFFFRFIPARAGNTTSSSARLRPWPVHPRASGEHDFGSGLDDVSRGSSPRERGTRAGLSPFRRGYRFIPARAGNTSHLLAVFSRQAVHPRASGEHFSRNPALALADGSSPRERGTLQRWIGDQVALRFIPARAGNTAFWRKNYGRRPVHPRASGEHALPVFAAGTAAGSSPRERGTQRSDDVQSPVHRFIPARAGNTLSCKLRRATRPVHPRASGEHSPRLADRGRVPGSSPRERGTHFLHLHEIQWKNGEDKFYR